MNSSIDKTIYLNDQHQLEAEAVDQTESTLELWIDGNKQGSDEEGARVRGRGIWEAGSPCQPV